MGSQLIFASDHSNFNLVIFDKEKIRLFTQIIVSKAFEILCVRSNCQLNCIKWLKSWILKIDYLQQTLTEGSP